MNKPIKIGNKVKILKIIDGMGDRKYIGKTGKVKLLTYGTVGGIFPNDPEIHVSFKDRSMDMFWTEELEIL